MTPTATSRAMPPSTSAAARSFPFSSSRDSSSAASAEHPDGVGVLVWQAGPTLSHLAAAGDVRCSGDELSLTSGEAHGPTRHVQVYSPASSMLCSNSSAAQRGQKIPTDNGSISRTSSPRNAVHPFARPRLMQPHSSHVSRRFTKRALAKQRRLGWRQDTGGPEAREDHEHVTRRDPEPDGSGAHRRDRKKRLGQMRQTLVRSAATCNCSQRVFRMRTGARDLSAAVSVWFSPFRGQSS